MKGIGCNRSGRISNSFPNKTDQFVEFSIKDPQSRSLSPLSAACGCHCTLYMFSVINTSDKQLVFCDDDLNQVAPVFLKSEDHDPVALFSGCDNFAAIGSEGEVIFIKRESVKTSSLITAVSLPDGEKASSIACCIDSIVVLSTNGRVFSSAIFKENNSLNFVCVNELNDHKFVGLSGTHNHCLFVSDNGIVFGRGSNEYGKLGIGEGINEKMLTPDELKGTNHQMNLYQIKLPTGYNYSTGDMIEILPENPPELAMKAIDALKLNPNQLYSLISNDSTIETFVPEKISVKQLFTQYMDLTASPNRAILRAFLTVANKEGTDRIDKMLDIKQEEDVKQYFKD